MVSKSKTVRLCKTALLGFLALPVVPAVLLPSFQEAQAEVLAGQAGAQKEAAAKVQAEIDAAAAEEADVQGAAAANEREEAAKKRRADIDQSVEDLLPLQPEEIREFMERQEEADSAVSPDPASMRTRVVSLSATPQKSPHVVHLTAGYSSTLLFQDATGAPWPVLSAILGNAEAFSLSQPGRSEEKLAQDQAAGSQGAKEQQKDAAHSHLVTVLPLKGHASSNLVLTLQEAVYPVVLHLVSAGTHAKARISDSLTVFRLDRAGPCARPASIGGIPETASEEVLSVLHGILPEDASAMAADPPLPGVRIWRGRGRLIVRTPYHAIWPAWLTSAENEGVHVYVMPETPSVVLSVDGAARSVKIKERPAQKLPSRGEGRKK